MPNFTLTVNGRQHVVNVETDTPLIYCLTNQLHLSGPRLGCGMAQCGSCAVLIEGKEVRSCVTPVRAVAGKQIVTVEGLPALWAAKKGLTAEQASTRSTRSSRPGSSPGSAVRVLPEWDDDRRHRLLERVPNPTVAQIKDAFTNTPPSPHLCRCGTYVAIIEAVQRAAKAMAV